MKVIDKIVKWVAFLNEVLQVAKEKYENHFPKESVEKIKETINEAEIQSTTDELEK